MSDAHTHMMPDRTPCAVVPIGRYGVAGTELSTATDAPDQRAETGNHSRHDRTVHGRGHEILGLRCTLATIALPFAAAGFHDCP